MCGWHSHYRVLRAPAPAAAMPLSLAAAWPFTPTPPTSSHPPSLLLQLGHFFGLPHPFPDGKHTCKVDGDGVADTPQQYAPNKGCEEGKCAF